MTLFSNSSCCHQDCDGEYNIRAYSIAKQLFYFAFHAASVFIKILNLSTWRNDDLIALIDQSLMHSFVIARFQPPVKESPCFELIVRLFFNFFPSALVPRYIQSSY